jgi:hypothetical protein
MTLYPGTSSLVEPAGEDQINDADLAYFAARNRRKIYSVVISEFKKSKLSQAQLGRRLGKRSDVICRWLSGPGNWTLDTVSNLMFGISGGELSYRVVYPLRTQAANYGTPDWINLSDSMHPRTGSSDNSTRINVKDLEPVQINEQRNI